MLTASGSLISPALTVSYARQKAQNVPLLRLPSCSASTNFATGSRSLLTPLRGKELAALGLLLDYQPIWPFVDRCIA